ncbi:GNAT family N-acetyltransferase [Orbus wheelerorum]|uniref:GNAT family N-acetyltransferase n=1 Tax=Orbus wheelerorum TaxID=3074111 RepID=UPI00370D58BC
MNKFFRHLIILQADNAVITKQLDYAVTNISGDWLTVSYDPLFASRYQNHFLPNHAKSLLGQEFKHAIFDARLGFNLDAFAIVTGTLIAESVFILILPEEFSNWQDQDSLRWSERPTAIPVPNFIAHLNLVILKQKNQYPDDICQLVIDSTHTDDYLLKFIARNNWHHHSQLKFDDIAEQQSIFAQLKKLNSKIIFISAKRGRGKSALAGMFAKCNQCWITAPNKNAVMTLMHFAPKDVQFFAPDELIIQLPTLFDKPDWLIIDEAAMIPLPIIAKLIEGFKHVLLTSTVDGYEGTGQGLLLKLFTQYQHPNEVQFLSLVKPIRWLENDPLEYFTEQLILANTPTFTLTDDLDNNISVRMINQLELLQSGQLLTDFFGLLKSAHYRTTLIDLRRLLDARNILLYGALLANHHIIGVLIAIKEGGLAEPLIDQVLKGYRRPKGNLVAQSLVAHGSEPLAAKLHSIRINRIAVNQELRRQGIASELLNSLIDSAKLSGCDFISVSFAYSTEMYHIWASLGFTIVHIGTHKEASSGSYAVMAIYPISLDGAQLCDTMQTKLARNWYWLRNIIDVDLPIIVDDNQSISDKDKYELSLFAETLYAYSASFAVLYRLANWVKKKQPESMLLLPLLLNLVDQNFCDKSVIKHYQLSGKNELLVRLRREIFEFITIQENINE